MGNAWWAVGMSLGSGLAVCVMVRWTQAMSRYAAVNRMGHLDTRDYAVSELWARAALGFAGFGVWVFCMGVVGGVTWWLTGR